MRVGVTGYSQIKDCGGPANASTSSVFEAIDFTQQIPKSSDFRSQGPSQRLACYVAGLALGHSGLIGSEADLLETEVMIATHFGERDAENDSRILKSVSVDDEVALISHLNTLRPSLFLTQLQNLFAANISIVHGVLGTSVTFLGETIAGYDAVVHAIKRIESGQSKRVLVGGVFNGNRPDLVEVYGLVAEDVDPEMRSALGVAAAFLVLEDIGAATKRGAQCFASIRSSDFSVALSFEDAFATFVDQSGPVLCSMADCVDQSIKRSSGQIIQQNAREIYNSEADGCTTMEATVPSLVCEAISRIRGMSDSVQSIRPPDDQFEALATSDIVSFIAASPQGRFVCGGVRRLTD